jgi:hypothetical protein
MKILEYLKVFSKALLITLGIGAAACVTLTLVLIYLAALSLMKLFLCVDHLRQSHIFYRDNSFKLKYNKYRGNR